MKRKYPSDLTDSQWNHIKDFFPLPKATGRPREVDLRQIVNAIFYLLFTGCQWRFMPNDYPHWRTVYGYFGAWHKDGIWYRIHETLRSELRCKKGRHKHPTAGSLDSQSVKTTSVPSSRGFDAGKKIMGRKRHILVDTLGLMLTLVVTTACVQDRDGLRRLLRTFGVHRKKLLKIWVDGGYRGACLEWVKARCALLFGSRFTLRRYQRICGLAKTMGRRTHHLRGSIIIGDYQKTMNDLQERAKRSFR